MFKQTISDTLQLYQAQEVEHQVFRRYQIKLYHVSELSKYIIHTGNHTVRINKAIVHETLKGFNGKYEITEFRKA